MINYKEVIVASLPPLVGQCLEDTDSRSPQPDDAHFTARKCGSACHGSSHVRVAPTASAATLLAAAAAARSAFSSSISAAHRACLLVVSSSAGDGDERVLERSAALANLL